MSTLTDRYVWAVVRSIPVQQRDDIERELRASLGDDIEARIEAGADARAAEHDALVSLGDPGQLAASYAGRPNFLVGPRYYFDYLRLLKLLAAIVLPIVAVVMAIIETLSGAGVGEVIGATVSTSLAVGVHLGFWTTLIFAVLERTDGGRKTRGIEWTPDDLPLIPDPKSGASISELVASAVFLVFFAGAIVWQQASSVFEDAAGDPIPVLQPELWSFWVPYAFVLIALELVFAVVLYARRGWTWWLAGINVLLNVAFVVPAVWLVSQGLVLNQPFVDRLEWREYFSSSVLAPIMIAVFIGVALWDVVDGFLKARRASRV